MTAQNPATKLLFLKFCLQIAGERERERDFFLIFLCKDFWYEVELKHGSWCLNCLLPTIFGFHGVFDGLRWIPNPGDSFVPIHLVRNEIFPGHRGILFCQIDQDTILRMLRSNIRIVIPMLLALTVPRRQVGQLAATYSSSLTNQIQHRSGVTSVCQWNPKSHRSESQICRLRNFSCRWNASLYYYLNLCHIKIRSSYSKLYGPFGAEDDFVATGLS